MSTRTERRSPTAGRVALTAATLLATILFPRGARAQSSGRLERAPASPAPASADEPVDPAASAYVVEAAPAIEAVRIDGALDDEVWRRARPASGFVQAEPEEGMPASEPTEVLVAYDERNLYIAARCYDREPEGLVVNEIREDFPPESQDTFEVILDTFRDRRNGYLFVTNPAGARADRQVANEGREVNASWDAVWFVSTRTTAEGWTVEMAIPFESLRFDMATAPVWGINFSRRIRRRNEIDFWAPVPRAYAITRVSLAGDLLGLPAATPGHDLRVKPYAAGSAVRGTGETAFHRTADVGVDVKYGVTPALTLDLTVHPDFAQVEIDEQRVNLTQFNLFFPEKREFFLENSGTFYVGDTARNTRVNLAPRADTDLLLFHSRRIGLDEDGRPIPILAGARLTGNVAGLNVGALTVQTDATETAPANNFSVLRIRKNLFRSSDVGAIVLARHATDRPGDYNRVYGVDATFRFFGNTDWASYFVKTSTPGVDAGQYAFRSTVNREGNFFHIKGGTMFIGEGFNDDLGFFRRVGVRKYMLDTGVRPRPRALQRRGIREMHPHIVWNVFTDHANRLVAKRLHTGYTFFFNNGGHSQFSVNPETQLITAPFRIHPDVDPIPAGRYSWTTYQADVTSDPSRAVSGNVAVILGGLWSGTQRTFRAGISLKPSYRFRLSLNVDRTAGRLELPRAEFVSSVWTLRANYSFATNAFLDSLVQWDRTRDRFNLNVRFNIMHHPLSDLFIVYNEQRFTTPENPVPAGRGLIVKFTQMLSF